MTAAVPADPPRLFVPPPTPEFRRARARLLGRIHRVYRTVDEPRQVGPWAVPFTRIADPDSVLDMVVEECDRIERQSGVRLKDPLHLPYWAELWDSAAGVGQVMLETATPWGGLRVLDLGCGMGLTGTVAAALGARVLFADLEAPALMFARLNSLPWAARVRARVTNWQTDDLGERFDVIVGADILYERAQWEHLDPFWRRHLADGGRILLGEPGRQTGDTFLDWAPSQGWTLQRQDRVVPTRPTPVRVLRLTR
ncbi:MAG TPA: methyltransferase [Humisphaera sp.]